ncbi:MAG: hypothetical protein ACFHWZ_07825 [Phycisphaerales bacterium]
MPKPERAAHLRVREQPQTPPARRRLGDQQAQVGIAEVAGDRRAVLDFRQVLQIELDRLGRRLGEQREHIVLHRLRVVGVVEQDQQGRSPRGSSIVTDPDRGCSIMACASDFHARVL